MSKKFSEMTPAAQFSGNDVVPIVDTGGNNRIVTGNQIKTFVTDDKNKNISDGTYTATSVSDIENWFITQFSNMRNGDIKILYIYPNFSSSSFFGGAAQSVIATRIENGKYRVALPNICGDMYYYSNTWHYSKATMSAVTP